MSPTLLNAILDMEREIRHRHWSVQRWYGDDGTRYPRDYYRAAEALKRRSHARTSH